MCMEDKGQNDMVSLSPQLPVVHFSYISAVLLTGTALQQWGLTDPWAQTSHVSNHQEASPWSPRDYSCIVNTPLGAGNDGQTNCSAFAVSLKSAVNISIPEHSYPSFISIICIIHPQIWTETQVLVYISNAFRPVLLLPLNACDNYIWRDIIWTRSSWASCTDFIASSIFHLTSALFHPFILTCNSMDRFPPFPKLRKTPIKIKIPIILAIFPLESWISVSLPDLSPRAVCIFKPSKQNNYKDNPAECNQTAGFFIFLAFPFNFTSCGLKEILGLYHLVIV